MIKTITYCDMCISEREIKTHNMQVIFTTEQTEGRSCQPYLSMQNIDLCEECWDIVMHGNYIFAHGAQGNNQYYFKKG